jgi:hypothetical protein
MASKSWKEPSPEVADLPRNSPEYLADLSRRLGLAYLWGAEEWSRISRDRALADAEAAERQNDHPGDAQKPTPDLERGPAQRAAGELG